MVRWSALCHRRERMEKTELVILFAGRTSAYTDGILLCRTSTAKELDYLAQMSCSKNKFNKAWQSEASKPRSLGSSCSLSFHGLVKEVSRVGARVGAGKTDASGETKGIKLLTICERETDATEALDLEATQFLWETEAWWALTNETEARETLATEETDARLALARERAASSAVSVDKGDVDSVSRALSSLFSAKF